ncbi:MAG: 5'-methylthioadenosine/adenosylhomocysteine nucleosidase [Spirochaetaceae bacterium]|nr:5'-methylthioadenosine/adenosylhomocysteine nucleosidase [Spirochaetaceae bacterium]
MKIGIICAGDVELEPFLEKLSDESLVEKAMLKFHKSTFAGHEIFFLYSGVCKVNAAIATQILIDEFKVDAVINSGVAGGMDPELKIFDTVISTEVAYHDVAANILTEFHPWMKSVFFMADIGLLEKTQKVAETIKTNGKIYWGRMVTGEAFITDAGRQEILDNFSPLSVDMETGSIAHVCYVNGIPFIAIRCITDTADHSGAQFFEMNCKKAARIASDITLALIAEID